MDYTRRGRSGVNPQCLGLELLFPVLQLRRTQVAEQTESISIPLFNQFLGIRLGDFFLKEILLLLVGFVVDLARFHRLELPACRNTKLATGVPRNGLRDLCVYAPVLDIDSNLSSDLRLGKTSLGRLGGRISRSMKCRKGLGSPFDLQEFVGSQLPHRGLFSDFSPSCPIRSWRHIGFIITLPSKTFLGHWSRVGPWRLVSRDRRLATPRGGRCRRIRRRPGCCRWGRTPARRPRRVPSGSGGVPGSRGPRR